MEWIYPNFARLPNALLYCDLTLSDTIFVFIILCFVFFFFFLFFFPEQWSVLSQPRCPVWAIMWLLVFKYVLNCAIHSWQIQIDLLIDKRRWPGERRIWTARSADHATLNTTKFSVRPNHTVPHIVWTTVYTFKDCQKHVLQCVPDVKWRQYTKRCTSNIM